MKKIMFFTAVLIYLFGIIYLPVIGMDEFAKEEDILPIEPDLIPFESLPIIEPQLDLEEVVSGELTEKGIGESPYYYYYDNKKVNLTPNPSWFSFFTDNPEQLLEKSLQSLNLESVIQKENIHIFEESGLALVRVNDSSGFEDIRKNFLQSKSGDPLIVPLPVFGSDEQLFVITDEIIARIKPEFGLNELRKLNDVHNVEIVKEIEFLPDTYILHVIDKSGSDGLNISNLYYETGMFEYVEPNYIVISNKKEYKDLKIEREKGKEKKSISFYIPNDQMFYPLQWYLHNNGQYVLDYDVDIDAPEAWAIYRNPKAMRVAVIDRGVNRYHEDLYGVVTRGYSAGIPNGEGLPFYTNNMINPALGQEPDTHGTPVAGIIAASFNNGLGVAGVCPSCKISSIWVDFINHDIWDMVEAIYNASSAGDDIINCSWSYDIEINSIKAAIDYVVSSGRGGRGNVVIFSAGNHTSDTVAPENQLVFPAKLSNVISVGASNGCDQRKIKLGNYCNFGEYWWSSHYGSGLDISAPGGWLWTTSWSGEKDDHSSTYADFNGTSGSAPIVSGVAGLILGRNPALRAKQVQYILERSADDIGPAGKDIYTGAGRVNAFKAIASTLQTKNRYYDFNGNGVPDITLFRPSNGTWYTYGASSVSYGISGDIPTAGDYNNDGLTEFSVFRPSNGTWYFRGQKSIRFGQSGDIPVPADYNNDGGADIAVFRPTNGTWYIQNRGQIPYGMYGDIPVPADYDGDGFTDIAVFRPSNGTWYIRNIGNLQFGQQGDIPVPTDYHGDGKADIAVFRPSTSTWHIRGVGTISFGRNSDIPIPFDFDGNGASEIAVYRPSNGTWYIRNRGQVVYGATTDIPVYRFAGHVMTIYPKTAGVLEASYEINLGTKDSDPDEIFDPETMESGTAELSPIGYADGAAINEKSLEYQEADAEYIEGFLPLDLEELNMPNDEDGMQGPQLESKREHPTINSKQVTLDPSDLNQWYYTHRQNLTLPSTGFPTKRK